MPPSKQRLSMLHKLRDGMLAISDALLELGRDEGHRLGLIQLHAAREALLREESRLAARVSEPIDNGNKGGART